MYQLEGSTVSFRVNEEERAQINQFADSLQTTTGQVFTNSKQVVFGMFTHCLQLESELKAEINNRIQREDTANSNENKYAELESTNNALNSELTELKAELEALKAAEPKTVEIPVPLELTENQVLLNLNGSQLAITKLISARRFANKMDAEQNSVEKQIISLAFDKQTVFNWAGNYRTFVELKDFK